MFELVKRFAKEVLRLQEKYGYTYKNLAGKSLDEITQMWIDNYFELYFLDDHYDAIEDCGPERYAQYYLHIRGVVPESEVTMWK